MKCCLVASMFALVCAATNSFAQVVYEPVQYQYGTTASYYYGGNDPRVFDRAERMRQGLGREKGYTFASATIDTHREVVSGPVRVYSDHVPFWNASNFGLTPTDAYNEANANLPRYFRKSDLIATGRVQVDGSVVVPAQPPVSSSRLHRGQIEIKPFVGPSTQPSTQPATQPRPLLIIPKDVLQPRPDASDKSVALVN
jgi:hypothetical protein